MTAPAFLMKLWHMLCDENTDNIISWGENGKSFIIKNQTSFTSALLPKYYKHNNLASFIRQLNKYGFKKKSHPQFSFEFLYFENPGFIKGDFGSILQIRRRDVKNANNEDDITDNNDKNKKTHIQRLEARLEDMEGILKENKIERDTLWKEYSILRQKQQEQSKVINKLVQFLILFMRSNENSRRPQPLMLKDVKKPDLNPNPNVEEIHETQKPEKDLINEEISINPEILVENFISSNINIPSTSDTIQEEKRGVKRQREDEEPSNLVVPSSEADFDNQPELDLIKDFLMYDNIPFPSRLQDLFGLEDPLGLKLPESFWKEANETSDNGVVVYDGLNDSIFDL